MDALLASKSVCIDHIAIAVEDLEKSLSWFVDVLGFSLVERRETIGKKSGMVSAVLRAGPIHFVLVQGTSPYSQVSRFVQKHGPGVQHVAILVDGFDEVTKNLESRGLEFLTTKISSPGLWQRFSKRDAKTGLMIEVIERRKTELFADHNVQQLYEQIEASESY